MAAAKQKAARAKFVAMVKAKSAGKPAAKAKPAKKPAKKKQISGVAQ